MGRDARRSSGRLRAAGIATALGLATVIGGVATGGPAADLALADLVHRVATWAGATAPHLSLAAALTPRWVSADPWPGAPGSSVPSSVPDVAAPDPPAPPVPPVAPRSDPEPPHYPGFALIPPNDARMDLAPMRDCPQPYGPASNVPLTVTTAPGSVTLSWLDKGDSAVKYFRVGAMPLSPTAAAATNGLNWQQVARVKNCGTVTAVLTGLQPGERYEIYVEVIGDGLLHHTVARSGIVTVP